MLHIIKRLLLCALLMVLTLSHSAYPITFSAEITDPVNPSMEALNEDQNSGIFDFDLLPHGLEAMSVETSKVAAGKWTLPNVTAHSAVLMDMKTGDILYARDASKKRPIASTTKILTAILALELADMNEISTVSEKADRVGESTIHLNKGDRIKLGELVEGALIRSGNDACVAIAEQAVGSLDEFIRLMNLKAVSLGAIDSHFANPHGLPDPNHYSTAYDLAVITRYALGNPEFSRIVAQKVATISFQDPPKSQSANNTNQLLFSYPLADGVKTGTTNAAGKCLVASATKDDRRLICVVLDAPDRFGDARRLLEWGFNNTEIVTLGSQGDFVTNYPGINTHTPVVLGYDLNLCVEKSKINEIRLQTEFSQRVYPPIKAGSLLGYYNVYLEDKLVKKVPLVAQRDFIGSPINFSGTLNIIVDRIADLIKR